MSEPKNPVLFNSGSAELTDGECITLRDLFAAFALAGMLSHSKQSPREATEHKDGIAQPAYQFADAMLAEREKKA